MLREAVRLQWREEARTAGFLFKLETADGKPADPPQFSAAVPNWGPGDTLYLGHGALRSLCEMRTPTSRGVVEEG